MKELKKGQFYGSHYQKLNFDAFTITDTEYTHSKVDWHYHENPYFTYLLQGKLFEANKKEEYHLKPGALLFHNWQDAHYNCKPQEYTRGFHIELNQEWFRKYDISTSEIEGSLNLKNPLVKNLMNKIFFESKVNDRHSKISIELLILEVLNSVKNDYSIDLIKKPHWVKKLNQLFLDTEKKYSLTKLSQELNIHPVHLSRQFHKYFGITFGQYVRHLKLNKAIVMIVSKKYSLTEICYQCGFYDQSHFISSFKSIFNNTPSSFLKQIS